MIKVLFLILVQTTGQWAYSATTLESAAVEEKLASILSMPEQDIDLEETVLLISRDRDSTLDLTPLREELDRLTQSVREKLKKAS
ncbi:MAG: hypothetical protein ACE5EK_06655, partial [Nitrospinales bacterium]